MGNVQLPEIILGLMLLLLGKKIFWLFVGVTGFVTGMDLAPKLFPASPELLVFALALTLGLAGAVLGMAFQWFGIIAAGFLGGGFLFFYFFPADSLAVFLIGGMIGAFLMAMVFDWALIILSVLVGAALISRNVYISDNRQGILFMVLIAAGLLVQSAIFLGLRK